jgi:hypothetical protein
MTDFEKHLRLTRQLTPVGSFPLRKAPAPGR